MKGSMSMFGHARLETQRQSGYSEILGTVCAIEDRMLSHGSKKKNRRKKYTASEWARGACYSKKLSSWIASQNQVPGACLEI